MDRRPGGAGAQLDPDSRRIARRARGARLRWRVPFDVGARAAVGDRGARPVAARLIAGYAGWGPGQLDEEVAASAWLTADIVLDLVFKTPADEMWEAAIRRLGAEPGSLQLGSGVH